MPEAPVSPAGDGSERPPALPVLAVPVLQDLTCAGQEALHLVQVQPQAQAQVTGLACLVWPVALAARPQVLTFPVRHSVGKLNSQ